MGRRLGESEVILNGTHLPNQHLGLLRTLLLSPLESQSLGTHPTRGSGWQERITVLHWWDIGPLPPTLLPRSKTPRKTTGLEGERVTQPLAPSLCRGWDHSTTCLSAPRRLVRACSESPGRGARRSKFRSEPLSSPCLLASYLLISNWQKQVTKPSLESEWADTAKCHGEGRGHGERQGTGAAVPFHGSYGLKWKTSDWSQVQCGSKGCFPSPGSAGSRVSHWVCLQWSRHEVQVGWHEYG